MIVCCKGKWMNGKKKEWIGGSVRSVEEIGVDRVVIEVGYGTYFFK